ncbi:zinc transporter ZIP5-like isoform X1 [Astyanax mexicanus]|uniref:Zinc transporter ZIP5-like isoform X1 n=1 Tax=Astyanax mexicanus TaxID=7994 RepID=A0A8T2LJ21_ASTMX|nr:zinc transporter ZIP5-like isoform X1 [Astyanax mexicanus]KAG9269823.1 zinc transporter ZIP5-like isoform X1 [Astyanax mexicanus]KAG9269825.1 zinc transporter ZIP5-like isoform X1 [Astyanax mexicanus]
MNQPNLRTVLSLTLLFHLYLSCVVASSKKILISDSNNRKAERDLSAQEHLDEAFEEQGYYLQRLFLEYGSNGTLTYEGLQNLLGSLGLGEVSVLEIRHGGTKHSSPSPSHSHPHAHVDHHHPHQPSSMPPAHKVSQPGSETLSETEMGGAADHSRFPASLDTSQTLQEGLSLLSNHLTKKHIHENCLNVTQLLWNFGLGQASHITPAHFTFLCPALLYQIDSGVCLRHTESSTEEAKNGVTFLKALGWASLALFVISLPSLLALGLAPLISPSSLRTFLCPMAAMAVGTLCGDALLHLLPHASSGPHTDHRDVVLKGLSVLGGLFLLFVLESLMVLRQQYKKSRKKRQQAEVVQELGALAGSSPPDQTLSSESGHGHSHAPPDNGSSGLGSVAWMVVMGDGIHNLTDGLAIGVAFSQSLTGGLSTTIAVFCHELPHELGDLAVLLAAGWPVRRLAVFSLLSALLGYVGVLGGTAMGHQWAQHSPWILTVTAGVFLYVALADMMPEMLHGDRGPLGAVKCFLLQCVGLLIGGAIMLCIALFEEDIAVSMGDS